MAIRVLPGPSNDVSRRFLTSTANGHDMHEYNPTEDEPGYLGASNWWAFGQNGCYWGLAKTFDFDASTYVWNRKNQFGNHIPPTPYGLVTMLPGEPAAGSPRAASPKWETDGDRLIRGGGTSFAHSFEPTLAEQQAAKAAMLEDLAAGAAAFPVRVTGDEVFSQTVQIAQTSTAPNQAKFVLYLVDPGFLTPAARNVTVTGNRSGTWTAVDRLTRANIPLTVNSATLWVPAGGIRVIELTRSY